ncbi:Spy/CpxP family protein refolding chaperone [Consotaella salsifontis]|uniref:LTXXQ motif family protein n=1 Tax=Consotaella salsifontis TaxID=1365950 RepID=A0A1T4RZR5_9HYPH|nr:Spy/CpxP family protein refolding chaperone [Consotaella salsifontis]SKA21455.1 LTXXQ motif family protein [Consotaella salsifontis]
MRFPTKTTAALLALGISVPALAVGAASAQPAPPPPPHDRPMAQPPHHWGHHGPKGFGFGMMGGGPKLLMLSGGLNAAETALGITDDQQDAWKAFTSAVINFAQTMRPGPMGPGMMGPDMMGPDMMDQMSSSADDDDEDTAPDQPPSVATPQSNSVAPVPEPDSSNNRSQRKLEDLPAVRMLDRMIDRQAQRAEAAKKLRDAVSGLSAVLTPDQVKTAQALLREMPHRGMHRGWHHRWRDDGQRGWRDGHKGRHGDWSNGPRWSQDSDQSPSDDDTNDDE